MTYGSFDYFSLKIILILASLMFMSSLNFMLSRVEHEKCFMTQGPGCKCSRHFLMAKFINLFHMFL